MLFTWSTKNLCIVFKGWHIRNTFSLIFSLILIIVLCAGYEAVRELSRRYEAALSKRTETPVPSKWNPPLQNSFDSFLKHIQTPHPEQNMA
jgi:Ctr copper transporter family